MKRSVAIADQLRIPSITIVVDMAIYIKAQDIRWADSDLHNRTVIRLGEFHTCMTFLAVIGKRFGDAGLFDISVESEVVAIGSANAVLQGRHYNPINMGSCKTRVKVGELSGNSCPCFKHQFYTYFTPVACKVVQMLF